MDFVVKPGIVTGFLGPNGAGKSTLMNILAGLYHPDAGTISINLTGSAGQSLGAFLPQGISISVRTNG